MHRPTSFRCWPNASVKPLGILSERIALVTGASRGIGAATAEALAAKGAHVILVGRTSGGLEEVEERIHQAGGTATIAPLDITDTDSIRRLAEAVAGRWGKLDQLILNAGTLGSLTPRWRWKERSTTPENNSRMG